MIVFCFRDVGLRDREKESASQRSLLNSKNEKRSSAEKKGLNKIFAELLKNRDDARAYVQNYIKNHCNTSIRSSP